MLLLLLLSGRLAAEDVMIVGEGVTAREEALRSTGSVEIIDPSSEGTAMSSLGEVLSNQAGVQVDRYGARGGRSYISIRGTNVNQVSVYVDGVLINDEVSGAVNLEELPLSQIERIEVYRGYSPLRYGTSGIGGVINIVTKDGASGQTGPATHRVELGFGSWMSTHLGVSRYHRFENNSYYISVSRDSSDGDFDYLDDNGTPVANSDDDTTLKRENNDYSLYGAVLKFDHSDSAYELKFSDDFNYKEQGISGTNNSIESARLETVRNTSRLGLSFMPGQGDRFYLDNSLYYSLRLEKYSDPENEIGIGPDGQRVTCQSGGATLLSEVSLPEVWQTLTCMLNPVYENYRADMGDETGEVQQRTRINSGVEDEFAFFDDRLFVVPNVRYDLWYDDFYISESPYLDGEDERLTQLNTMPSYKGGVRFFPYRERTSFFSLNANISRSYRVPTFVELFGQDGSVLGNPDLDYETSINWDGGFDFSHRFTGPVNSISCAYSYFDNRIDDIIVFIYNSQNTIIAQNISSAHITGHEISAETVVLNHAKFSANFTVQEPVDTGRISYYNGNYLPYRPRYEFYGALTLFNALASLTWSVERIGASYRDRANSDFYYISERTLHNGLLKVTPLERLELSFEVRNIADVMAYDRVGYPLPGRSYFASGSYTF